MVRYMPRYGNGGLRMVTGNGQNTRCCPDKLRCGNNGFCPVELRVSVAAV